MRRNPKRRVIKHKNIKQISLPNIVGGAKLSMIKNNKCEINEDEVKITGLISMEKRIRRSMKQKNLTEKDIRHVLGKKYEN